jgi:hypothetical protein
MKVEVMGDWPDAGASVCVSRVGRPWTGFLLGFLLSFAR